MHLPAKTIGAILILFFVLAGKTFAAESHDVSACDRAAAIASKEVGVPLAVLQAVARVESGRTTNGSFHPWPWSANFGGQAHYYASSGQAIADVSQFLSEVSTSADVGCFQINTRWHGHAFDDLAAMFDPETNANYAAHFLAKLFRETGNWDSAVGAYHSKNEALAVAYRNKVAKMIEMPVTEPVSFESAPSPRVNLFPLLQSGKVQTKGSLVPLANSGATPFLR